MAISSHQTIEELLNNDDNYPTLTSSQQFAVERSIEELYAKVKYAAEDAANPALTEAQRNDATVTSATALQLRRNEHIKYMRKALLQNLSSGYESLDSSRPWLCYWNVHGLALLGHDLDAKESKRVVEFLRKCYNSDGGFGGGPRQMSHLAPTYAALNTLCTVGTPEAYSVVDRARLEVFLLSLKCTDGGPDHGGFSMHHDGEVDVRGTYCAVSVATLCKLDVDKIFSGTVDWLLKCQTYEGGFGGVPTVEAHGGYTYCAFAALVMLRRAADCDLKALLHWATHRQMKLEGGFQGRTNKLVDGCYSFWQGGVFPSLTYAFFALETNPKLKEVIDKGFMNDAALQEYILVCCQDPSGGLLDKPSKGRDYYHTCYTLSGLSTAQHHFRDPSRATVVVGGSSNELRPTHALHNVLTSKVLSAYAYYSSLE